MEVLSNIFQKSMVSEQLVKTRSNCFWSSTEEAISGPRKERASLLHPCFNWQGARMKFKEKQCIFKTGNVIVVNPTTQTKAVMEAQSPVPKWTSVLDDILHTNPFSYLFFSSHFNILIRF